MQKLVVSFAVATILIPSFASSAEVFTRNLSIGSKGGDVVTLQKLLTVFGFFKEEATGYFGKLTSAAVAAFQTENDLEPVGSVGPKTRALLNTLLAGIEKEPEAVITAPPADATMTPETITATTTPPIAPPAEPLTVTVQTPALLPAFTREITLTLSTNQAATCRFSTTALQDYPRKTAFKDTGGTVHKHDFINLQNGALYVYYVQCEDAKTLAVSPEITVSFRVAQPTSSLYLPSQLAQAAESISSIRIWTMLSPLKTMLDALTF